MSLVEKVLNMKIIEFEALEKFDVSIYCDCVNMLGRYKGNNYKTYLSRIQEQRTKLVPKDK